MKLKRRELIKWGAGASLLAVGGGLGKVMAAEPDIHQTTIPSSGQKVPSVGIGTVDFRGATDSDAMTPLRQTLEIFHQQGGRVIDTSPNYGNSEEVLGYLLDGMGLRDDVFMATKVDRENAADGIDRMESSFERLGPPIDLMQVHNLRGTDKQLETMLAWKKEGRFSYVGVTTHRDEQHAEVEQIMRRYPLDFVQVNYSIADREAAERLLPLAQDRGVAVLVNRPFGDGRLFGAVRGIALPEWAVEIDAESWGQVFLKYILSHPAATIPIPGTTKPHHARDNMGAMRGRLPDAVLRREMERSIDGLLGS
jgi:aryl-alcohol dehydrogenase-like predicted oxidoreductase